MAAFVAVSIIGIVGWRYHRESDNVEDRQVAGDNLYYMGFLFTLVSLILALMQLFVMDTQADVNERANELIGNFSVALFSTVAGIFARILFQSTERESREQSAQKMDVENGKLITSKAKVNVNTSVVNTDIKVLQEDLMRLRLALREASDAFLHFSRISNEQCENVVTTTGSIMQRQSENLSKASLHQLEQMNSSLKSLANAFQVEMNKLTDHCKNTVDEFLKHLSNEAYQGISDTSQVWKDTAIQMKADGERHIEGIYGNVTALLQNTKQAWSQINDLTGKVGETVVGMQENVESLQQMVSISANAGSEMKTLIESMSQARKEFNSAAEAANKSTEEIESGIRGFTDAKSKLDSELIETRINAVKDYREATVQFTKHVSEQLESSGDRLQSVILKMANDMENHQKIFSEQLGKASELGKQLGKQMSDEINEWSKLSEHTRKSLVEAADHLVKVVKKS